MQSSILVPWIIEKWVLMVHNNKTVINTEPIQVDSRWAGSHLAFVSLIYLNIKLGSMNIYSKYANVTKLNNLSSPLTVAKESFFPIPNHPYLQGYPLDDATRGGGGGQNIITNFLYFVTMMTNFSIQSPNFNFE